MSDLVKRAIQLQLAVSEQIRKHGHADVELINDLNNLHETLNSHETELLLEWYYEQNVNKQIEEFEKFTFEEGNEEDYYENNQNTIKVNNDMEFISECS